MDGKLKELPLKFLNILKHLISVLLLLFMRKDYCASDVLEVYYIIKISQALF